MKLLGLDLADFSGQYLRAALIVSLMSVWMLVGLFYYLNHYTKRDYFTAWTAAWLFYALWLTLGLKFETATPDTVIFKIRQCCVAVSAVFLLWGSLRFLKIPVRQTLFGLFMLFLLVWTFAGPRFIPESLAPRARLLEMQLPVFVLVGLSSVFAGVCFFRLRKKMPFVGAGMLAAGFFLWGLYLASYPLSQQDEHLSSAGFFVAAVLQLFIAVSMVVLVLEEIRFKSEQTMAEIAAVRSEKEALQIKVITTEEQCRSLYDRVRNTDGLQKAYEELRQTQQAVVQQERLRALGQMASGVAHDVNNALSPVVAYADILLMKLPDLPKESRGYLQTIKQAGQDIAKIVARMREFYRRRADSEPLVPVDINQIVQEVTELTRPRWRDISQREGIFIQVIHELEPRLPSLSGDPSEFREALINLVFNAVDALPKGGTITFVTRTLAASGANGGADAPARIQVEVKDNGIGMDETTRQHCLEPFYSTKTLNGGTGLGLAMVYGMVQRHEGNIEIDSAPGRGTCMRLTFPIAESALSAAVVATPRIESKHSLRILCIDDEELIRQLLADCLSHYAHQVVTATNGQQGLDLFRAAALENRPFEVVITDLGMPKMDGHELARAIKAGSPRTPVIMMTGWGAMMKEKGETVPDVDAVVGKPPQINELNNLILRVVSAAQSSG
ncbi:MAG TPA: ATP-binding protein [Candidatus Acidoferrales bacterium]|jgi:signal transduction histidine kinase/ActR/RegA family two-component response regulator|nr:ATP-binding protein [Candidatus Acidoferrales bacterium]